MNILKKTFFKISIQTYCEISYAINVSNLMHSSSLICLMIMWSTYSTIVLYRIVYKVVTIDWWLCLLKSSTFNQVQGQAEARSWVNAIANHPRSCLSLSLRHAVPPSTTRIFSSPFLSHTFPVTQQQNHQLCTDSVFINIKVIMSNSHGATSSVL